MSSTKIYASATLPGNQAVVYSMNIDAKEELAMILPIPAPADTPEDAVRFVNVEGYPTFFDDLERAFPNMVAASRSLTLAVSPRTKRLEVVDVGSFVASFVPTIDDFSRLDPRFRLDTSVWESLPQYGDYGFAVFQLKPGKQKVHPMAFEFPSRDAGRLFFPTVHIHDGKVHRKARFDHALYCQNANALQFPWIKTTRPAETFMNPQQLGEILEQALLMKTDDHCYRMELHGKMANEDIWL